MLFYRPDYKIQEKDHLNELYDKIQKVDFKIGGRDERLLLNVKVSLLNKLGINDDTILKVIISDPNNPMLLYTTEINSEIYNKLKQKLGLLIDFPQFPNTFINLISLCNNETDVSSKYILSLEEMNSDPYNLVNGKCILFKIVEINQFQRLCLIAVHIIPGSKTEINSFLSNSIQKLKYHIEKLERKIKENQEHNLHTEQIVNAKNLEINKIKAEKNTLNKTNCDLETEMKDKNVKLEKMQRGIKTLQDQIFKCEREKNEFKDTCSRLETELKDKSEKYEKMQFTIKTLQDEILKSEKKLSLKESELREIKTFITNYKQRYTNLEKDLLKANEIIVKMNKEIHRVKTKLTEREKIIVEQDKIIEKFKLNIQNSENIAGSKSEQITKLQQDLEDLKLSLKTNEETIKTKDDNIKKLSQENRMFTELLIKESQKKNCKCVSSSVTSSSRPTSVLSRVNQRNPIKNKS